MTEAAGTGSIPTTDQVCALFARMRPVDPDTNFFEAGLTSRALAEILPDLQDLGLSLKLVDLYRFPTVRALVAEAARRADPAGTGPARPKLPWT